MKLNIILKKKKLKYIILINNLILFKFKLNKIRNINISLVIYNYIILMKILRIYGLKKPLIKISNF